MPVKVQCEKEQLATISSELRSIGQQVHVYYVPAFEPSEVAEAELLRLRISVLCGQGFSQWAAQLQLPSGTLVMDKREIRRSDIALTYLFDVVISERLREVFSAEKLTGWRADVIQHVDPKRDRFGPLYALRATTELPALAPNTELHVETHEGLRRSDPLFGTTGLFQHGPLIYRRQDITAVADFNFTRERFGEAPEAHPLFVVSQRTWRVFHKHKIPKVEAEPVVVAETPHPCQNQY